MKRIITFLLIGILFVLTSCAAQKNNTITTQGVTFTDALGHNISVSNPQKVIVASGSFAQVWLLSGGSLYATTQDAFDNGFVVAENTQNIGALHQPSLEQIIEFNPDLVIFSSNIPGQVDLYESLDTTGITTAYFSVEVFEDYLQMLKICTDITGRQDLYVQNGSDIQVKIDEVIARTKSLQSPKILLLRAGAGKVMVRNSDNMTGMMLKDMGCINIADSENGLLDHLSMETILQEDPDFIFVTTMGESNEKAQKSLDDTLLSNPAWASLSAVKKNHYVLLPKDLFQLKPNNRWAEAYEKLWEIIYEEE